MKFLKTGALAALFCLCAAVASAQTIGRSKDGNSARAELFADLPARLSVSANNFSQLFQKPIGEAVTLPLASVNLSGTVVSKSPETETRFKTIVIKLINRPGALFTISGLRQPDGTYRYSGRMLSLHANDAYELMQTGSDFTLEKKQREAVVTD